MDKLKALKFFTFGLLWLEGHKYYNLPRSAKPICLNLSTFSLKFNFEEKQSISLIYLKQLTNYLEKTLHPFISVIFGQTSLGPTLLFQALPGRKRALQQYCFL